MRQNGLRKRLTVFVRIPHGASISIAVTTLILVSLSVLITPISPIEAKSAAKDFPPRMKLEHLVKHKQFEPESISCSHAEARCSSLLHSIESGAVKFIRPVASGGSARAALIELCGSRNGMLGGPLQMPHGGWPAGQIVRAKGPITLYRLPDLAHKFPRRKLYLARVENFYFSHDGFSGDGDLDLFSAPGCRRLGGFALVKSLATARPVGRNEWIAAPVVMAKQVFLLSVYHGYHGRRVHVMLVSPRRLRQGGGHVYWFSSR
ncbi:MAG: hypothetical protein ACRDHZ_23530 [Ktedonobacteraceae bacterium]